MLSSWEVNHWAGVELAIVVYPHKATMARTWRLAPHLCSVWAGLLRFFVETYRMMLAALGYGGN